MWAGQVLGFDEVNANQIFHLLDDDESGEAAAAGSSTPGKLPWEAASACDLRAVTGPGSS